MNPKIRGRKTTFGRELKPQNPIAVASNVENFTPEVPVSITLSERNTNSRGEKVLDEDGNETTRCGVLLSFGRKRPTIWADAEQLLSLAIQHSKECAEAFYNEGKIVCNIAIGVINGRFVVEPAV